MSNQDYKRLPFKFFNGGIDLNNPVDVVRPPKFPILENIRAYLGSPIQARPGLTQAWAAVGTGFAHSLKRLNDDSSGSNVWTRIAGIGTELYYGQAAGALADTGYSGNPLALVAYRPEQSPSSWIYIGDSTRIRKVDVSGNMRPIGYPPPTVVPTVALASTLQVVINDCDTAGDWTNTGTAGAATLLTGATGRINSAAVTITQILYDSGTTGWACIQPSLGSAIGPGLRLIINTGGGAEEIVNVQEVHPGTGTATTILAITYDSGTSGLCTIQLTVTPDFLARNSLIRNTTIAENVRVLSVTVGPDGTKSFRCSTSGTFAATNAISVLPSFRAFCVNNHAAAETLRSDAIRSAVTAGTGHLADTIALDLSLVGTRPIQPEDWIHLSVRFDNPANVTEVRVYLDVDAATNDFTRNYYQYAFRPSDLTPAIRLTQPFTTGRITSVERSLLDEYTFSEPDAFGNITVFEPMPKSEQVDSTGDVQWYEVWLKVSDLIRVGSDTSRTLANVAATRISFTVTANTNCDFDSWWIGGGYGPDGARASDGYLYRYRARDSTTGAKSNWSPATRSPELPNRQRTQVSVTGLTVALGWTGCNKLDIQRFGGEQPQWTYAGTVINDASGALVIFNDDFSDADIASNLTGEEDNFQPWPLVDVPKSGICNVVGTAVSRVSGDNFSTSWSPGTVININGINYVLYGNPASTSLLHIVASAGSQTSVAWYVAEPLLQGMPLPALWGPVEGILYGCGDLRNQGTLYGTKGNDADSAPETQKIEITSPSEPLINGVAYDGSSYVFSSERMFRIRRTKDGPNFSEYSEVPNGKGLFNRWAICVGPKIWYLSKDGIYETVGGPPVSITNEDLYPLFPHDGQAGTSTGGISPPTMDSSGNLRLSFYDGELFFDYVAADTSRVTLVYNTITRSWSQDSYGRRVAVHYGEEGAGIRNILVGGESSDNASGKIYSATGTSDDGVAIAGQIRTGSMDDGDPNVKKLWGDVQLDLDRDGATITIVQGFNQHGTTLTAQTVSTLSGRQRYEFQNNSGAGTDGYNASLDISWSSATAVPKLYGWEQCFLLYPRELLGWQTLATAHGLTGYQHLRDAYISLISTAAVTLTIIVDGVTFSYTIASTSGAHRKIYIPVQVMKGKVFSYRLTSTEVFRMFIWDSTIRCKQWGDPGGYRTVNPFTQGNNIV